MYGLQTVESAAAGSRGRRPARDNTSRDFVPLVRVSIARGEVILNRIEEHLRSETVRREEDQR